MDALNELDFAKSAKLLDILLSLKKQLPIYTNCIALERSGSPGLSGIIPAMQHVFDDRSATELAGNDDNPSEPGY